ncbi:MAG TPA: hypothetical protein VHY84_01995, partial [Bryobacteraceae bacterium]|nr:hypothetical protein [Bryobacteraceae bacterium]
MDKEENQRQVFLFVHEPLEIAVAIPTFPQPRLSAHGKVEIQKAGFPLSHARFLFPKSKNERRINPACYPHPSGSSQDWKTL